MAYNLIIDQGNSRAKVSVFEGNDIVAAWTYASLNPDVLDSIAANYPFKAAIYCSVVIHGEGVMVKLRSLAGSVYELTSLLPLPIKINYSNPVNLGRDRIAAAAGAAALFPGREALVVDAGTAITYDKVTPEGAFAGGNIAPGLWMRAESLHTMTSRLPRVDVESVRATPPMWGDSTESAIRSGVLHGVMGEISYYRRQIPADAITILTGGDARILESLMMADNSVASPIIVDPDLVSKGLNSILLYNENR